MQQRKIIIADDHPLFRAALKQSLLQTLGASELIEAGSFDALQEVAEAHSDSDLILLDLKMPGISGFSGLAYLRGRFPSLPVMVVSAHEEPKVMHRALELGASGFVPKSTSLTVLVEALRAVLAGEIWLPSGLPPQPQSLGEESHGYARRLASLTPQQFRVLGLMADGLLNKQIADRLEVSEATVKAHVTAILRKLHVHSRTQAAVAFQSLAIDQAELSSAL